MLRRRLLPQFPESFRRQAHLAGDRGPGKEEALRVDTLPLEGPDPSVQPLGLELRAGMRRRRLHRGLGGQEVVRNFFRLLQPGGGQLGADLRLEGPQPLHQGRLGSTRVQGAGDRTGAVQDPVQGVVVLDGNGIQLVVVAAGAGHGEPLEGPGEGVDLVVHHVGADLAELDAVVVPHLPHEQKGGTGGRLVDAQRDVDPGILQQVAGDVLPHEMIVGNVLVEGADQVVPVAPGSLDDVVPLVAVGLGETDHVHPVPGPVFAEVGRVQEAVHEVGIGLAGGIPEQLLHAGRIGRQPDDGETEAPGQRANVGPLRRLQSLLAERRQEEPVDRGSGPTLMIHPGRIGIGNRLERPVLPGQAGVEVGLFGEVRSCGPRSSHPDPALKLTDLGVGEHAAQGHLQVLVADGLDDQALLRVTGDQCGPPQAALQERFPGIHS